MLKLGIDLGGTNIRIASLDGNVLENIYSLKVDKSKGRDGIIDQIVELINKFDANRIEGIGIGVPSYVDIQKGIVYDTVNLPGWDEVPLKEILESRLQLPVQINNDANCFALGEKFYGKGKGYRSMVGLTLGTGVGAGIIIEEALYAGQNCGAGEIGALPYLDKDYEFYASGKFFTSIYNETAQELYLRAQQGDNQALGIFKEYGYHLGELLKLVLLTFDPEAIIIGGSVSNAWKYFHDTMMESVNKMSFKQYAKNIQIEVSSLQHAGIYGSAHLVEGRLIETE